MEAPRLQAVPARHVGRLDEGPGEVLVAVTHVALTLLLAVGVAGAVHTARIRSVIAHVREALDRTGFQQDHRRQDMRNAGHRTQPRILRPTP